MSRRVATTAAAGVAVCVAMVLLDMQPRLVLVGFVVVAVAAASFLLLDLGRDVAAVDWYGHRFEHAATSTVDLRIQHLRASLHRSTSRRRQTAAAMRESGWTDQTVETLVGLIDDVLLSVHGIDRSTDPARAAVVLGPDLTRFVSDAGVLGSLSARRLTHIVTLIEQLSDRAPAAAEEPA